jgi:hypothetical protein
MPIPYYSDTDLLSEDDLNKVKNRVNMKMKELYSILEPTTSLIGPESYIPSSVSSGKSDSLIDIIIDLILKNGAMLIDASSYIITKDSLTKAEIKKIQDNIKIIKTKWDNWKSNRPDKADLDKLTDLQAAINDILLLKESEEQLNEQKSILIDKFNKLDEFKVKISDEINIISSEISTIQSELGTPAVAKLSPSEENDIIDEYIKSDPDVYNKFQKLEEMKDNFIPIIAQIQSIYNEYQPLEALLAPKLKVLGDIEKKIKIKQDDLKKIITDNKKYEKTIEQSAKRLKLLEDQLKRTFTTPEEKQEEINFLKDKAETELTITNFTKKIVPEPNINIIIDDIKKLEESKPQPLELQVFNEKKLEINKRLNDQLQLINENKTIDPTNEIDFEQYFKDTTVVIQEKETEIVDLNKEINKLSQDYLKQYIIDNNLQPLDDTKRNELIVKLQSQLPELQNAIKEKQTEYNDFKLKVDQFDSDFKLKMNTTLSNINTSFGSTDSDVLQTEATKIEDTTGIRFNTEYEQYQNDLQVETEKLNINLSVFNAVKVKIDTDSLLDFDKTINKIIFNFKTINDEFKTVIDNVASISQLKYDKLIKTYDRFKIDALIIKKKIKELPGDKLSLSGSQGQLKIQFADIENNVKSLFELLNNFDIQIDEFKKAYNPTRPVPKINIGGYMRRYL